MPDEDMIEVAIAAINAVIDSPAPENAVAAEAAAAAD